MVRGAADGKLSSRPVCGLSVTAGRNASRRGPRVDPERLVAGDRETGSRSTRNDPGTVL